MGRHVVPFVLVALLTASAVAAVLPLNLGQETARDAHAYSTPRLEVRVAAQRLENGSTEFALQIYDQTTGHAGPRLLPNPRFLSGTTVRGRWRHSGPLELPSGYSLRISARILTDGRIEFAVQQRSSDNGWSERILPHQRMFTAYPQVGQWLVSSYVTIPQATYVPITNGKGRFSYTGRYYSNVFRGVIGTGLRNYSQTWDVQLSLLCQYAFNISLLNLPEFDADSVDVTLAFSNGTTTTSAWRRYDSTILQSPDPWADFDRLQQAKFVSVHIPGLLPVAQEFDLTDMFTTPIQENLEHCGNYAPGETREFPATLGPYHTGKVTTFNGASSEARWDWWIEPGRLSRVTLRERLLRLPGEGGESDESDRLTLYMSCDRQGPIVQMYGSVLDEAVDRSVGGDPIVLLSLDGEPLHDVTWRLRSTVWNLQDDRSFLKDVRAGTRLLVSVDPGSGESFDFDLAALFGSPAQSSFDECVNHPVRTEGLPYTKDDPWVRSSVPGVSYRIGPSHDEGLSWWTGLGLDEQSAWPGEPYVRQRMSVLCGLDGISVDFTSVGSAQPVFLRGWPLSLEVRWRTEVNAGAEVWDVWRLGFHRGGFSLSPQDDRDFFEQIHGAESLTINVPTEPLPVTLYFTLGEIGVWDTPAAINLEACDHGGLEPG